PFILLCFTLTADLHHSVLGLHHQLLGREVVDVQANLPVFLGLLDLGHAAAHLAGQSSGLVCHHVSRVHHGSVRHHGRHVGGQDGGPQVPRPVGAGECGKLLGQGGHAEGLVEDAAALVPVAEWIPAGGPQQGERNTSLGHGGCVGCGLWIKSPLASQEVLSQSAVCLSAVSFYTH
uniref:Uncharacterized protein n=1 Tax=Salarias fasciatus TaxID=181472 RepID=A0A672FWC6_SALFA